MGRDRVGCPGSLPMATTSAPGTEFSGELPVASQAAGEPIPPGLGPWRLAGRRLRRNRVALFFGAIFLLVVILCLLAPIYSQDIAHISPDTGLPDAQIHVGGKKEFVIGLVYIPYVAKPVRGQVLTLREREFVDAARQQGLSHARIMFSEILPNLSSTIIVFIPLILANAILLEAGLSFLGAGVQPPNASWGTMISDGIGSIYAAF